jgi:hypothetical protein
MKETDVQLEYRAKRKQDILDRISHALPDWSAVQLDELATQMTELELRGQARARAYDTPRRR